MLPLATFQPLTLSPERLKPLLADLASGNDAKAHAVDNELADFDPRLALDDEALQNLFCDDMRPIRLQVRAIGEALVGFRTTTTATIWRSVVAASPSEGFFQSRLGWGAERVQWRSLSTGREERGRPVSCYRRRILPTGPNGSVAATSAGRGLRSAESARG